MKLIVGIDFGTSTTVVRYRMEDSNIIQSIKESNGNDIIPSVIYKNPETGIKLYGSEAFKCNPNTEEGEIISNFKMNLLNPSKREQAKLHIEEFLTHVYGLFKNQTQGLNPTETEINVSYPAKWDDEMIRFMKEAVHKAGFTGTITGVKEPLAATQDLLYRHLQDLQKAKLIGIQKSIRIFVLDMGAGTTDISILKLSIDEYGIPHISEPLLYPSKSEPFLCGGREIDELMQQYLINYFSKKNYTPMPECIELPLIKDWKEQTLSPNLKHGEKVSLPNSLHYILKAIGLKNIVADFSFNRIDFEYSTKEHWEKLYKLIQSSMLQYKTVYGIGAEDIDFVCLTGGHSTWYTVPLLFNGEGLCNGIAQEGEEETLNFEKLKKEPWRMEALSDSLPHESVARGLCLMDQKLIGALPSSNNVWVKITVDDKSSEIMQIIDKTSPLPITNTITHEIICLKHLFDSIINTQINIYIGENLENAETYSMQFKNDSKSFWNYIREIIFPTFIVSVHKVKFIINFTMTEEGLFDISGTFNIDNNKICEFTLNDLYKFSEFDKKINN